MKFTILLSVLFSINLFGKDFSGEWQGKLFGAGLGKYCTVKMRIAQTKQFFIISSRTYQCETGESFKRQMVWFKIGKTTASPYPANELLDDNNKVVGYLSNAGDVSQISALPEGGQISRFGYYNSGKGQDIYFDEFFQKFTMQGTLKNSLP
jgi:hypothetical protein